MDQLNHILGVLGSPTLEDLQCIKNDKVCWELERTERKGGIPTFANVKLTLPMTVVQAGVELRGKLQEKLHHVTGPSVCHRRLKYCASRLYLLPPGH